MLVRMRVAAFIVSCTARLLHSAALLEQLCVSLCYWSVVGRRVAAFMRTRALRPAAVTCFGASLVAVLTPRDERPRHAPRRHAPLRLPRDAVHAGDRRARVTTPPIRLAR